MMSWTTAWHVVSSRTLFHLTTQCVIDFSCRYDRKLSPIRQPSLSDLHRVVNFGTEAQDHGASASKQHSAASGLIVCSAV